MRSSIRLQHWSIVDAWTLVLGLALATAVAPTTACAEDAKPLVAPEGGPWASGDGFSFERKEKKTRRSVSGIACGDVVGSSGRRICLFAFDEGVEARFGALGPDRLTPMKERVVLRPSEDELDAEGAALDREYFYVTGSHSAKRGDCTSNPGSRHVVRFRRDAATGLAARKASGELLDYADSGPRLWEIMASLAELAPYVGERKCLGTEPPEKAPDLKGQRGVNIEGIAAADGRLTFGFRGPANGGIAPVLTVNAAGLFGSEPADPQVTFLDLGPRRAIRDLQSVKGGLLVLAGPDDDAASADAGWLLSLWDGKVVPGVVRPKVLAKLDLNGLVRKDCDEEIKPEAVTVVRDDPNVLQVVVLSDGMCDGGPLAFRIRR
ncbi:MAG: DUF3616 domain-containing protein [Hyphomicrobiales bacterium]|mgnify:CR=1 FL=1